MQHRMGLGMQAQMTIYTTKMLESFSSAALGCITVKAGSLKGKVWRGAWRMALSNMPNISMVEGLSKRMDAT